MGQRRYRAGILSVSHRWRERRVLKDPGRDRGARCGNGMARGVRGSPGRDMDFWAGLLSGPPDAWLLQCGVIEPAIRASCSIS